MRLKIFGSILLALLLTLFAMPVPAYAIPPVPHAFYGDVTINGSPAPAGTTVGARGTGVLTGIDGNPVTTTALGKYGSTASPELDLIVQGDVTSGEEISFFVNGVATGQTYPFDSGETTGLDLSVTIVVPPTDGVERAAPTYVETNLFGLEADFRISRSGEIVKTIEATSADGNLTITIPKGTIALDKKGKPLGSLEVAVDKSPPDPPTGANIIGLAYDFGPLGATFDPPITFTWSYDPDTLPEGVAEEDLVLAYYDEVAGEWVELDCVVDTENDTITASVEHFTTFAIIGVVTPPPPPAPVPAPEPAPTPAPAPEPVPAPPPEPEPAPVPTPPINWPLIGWIIFAVIVVGVPIYFLVFRRRAY